MTSITNIEELKANLLIDPNLILHVKDFYEIRNLFHFLSIDKLRYMTTMLKNIPHEIINVKMRIEGVHSHVTDCTLIYFPLGFDLTEVSTSIYTIQFISLYHQIKLT